MRPVDGLSVIEGWATCGNTLMPLEGSGCDHVGVDRSVGSVEIRVVPEFGDGTTVSRSNIAASAVARRADI